MADTYQANLAGLDLELQDLGDTFQKALARHEFPYRDGALVEDLGQKARTIKVRCYFFEETYDAHHDLIALLDAPGPLEFVHPKYGVLRVGIESLDVRHDDRTRTAEIDLGLVESRLTPEPVADQGVQAAAEDGFEEGQQEQAAALGDEMAGEGADVEAELDPEQGILEQAGDLAGDVRDFVTGIDSAVRTLESTMNQIQNPINSIMNTIDYAANLPGRVLGAVSATVERISEGVSSLRNAPSRFLTSLRDGVTALRNSFDGLADSLSSGPNRNSGRAAAYRMVAKHLDLAGAQRAALEAAVLFAADEAARQDARRQERTSAFDASGNRIGARDGAPILDAAEIERSLAITRAWLQEAVAANRGMQSFKTLAAALLDHVNRVKLESDRIVTVTETVPLPLHIICLKHGLPYNYAERIHSINRIRKPNFTSGEVKIYAP